MDAEAYPQEVLADEEPKYLRRQKPLEIKRRKFGRKAWKTYLRVTLWAAAGIAGAVRGVRMRTFSAVLAGMALLHPDQVEHRREPLRFRRERASKFLRPTAAKSVLRIPLDERRAQLEAMPWVEQATVRRALPNRIRRRNLGAHSVAFLARGERSGAGGRARRDPRAAARRAIFIFRW